MGEMAAGKFGESLALVLSRDRLGFDLSESTGRAKMGKPSLGWGGPPIPVNCEMAIDSVVTKFVEGASASMRPVEAVIRELAQSDVPVLLLAERGAGKHATARRIHDLSRRSAQPFRRLVCSNLKPEDLEKFSGEDHQSAGTIFLEELGELNADCQAYLQSMLSQRTGNNGESVRARFICGSALDLELEVKARRLREDLYYRISAITVYLPPLRERREDIVPLATSFLKRFDAQAARNIGGFTPAASEAIKHFDWPGNVRQLQNEIQRAVLMCEGNMIDTKDLSITTMAAQQGEPEDLTLMEAMERNAIMQMLKETGGNKLETAKRLGIGRQTLYNKIKIYEIEGA